MKSSIKFGAGALLAAMLLFGVVMMPAGVRIAFPIRYAIISRATIVIVQYFLFGR